MKYLLLCTSLLILCSCSYNPEYEDYNFLEDNSLRFIRTKDDTSILINKDNEYYLLLLNNQNVDIEVDYLIKVNNIKSNIESKEEYYLKENLTINEIEFKKNDKIEIIMEDKKICIYLKELDQNNYLSCDFLYLYNPDNNLNITLSSNLSVLFYHSYTKFNYKFMLHLADVWIDSSTIDASSYTTLTLIEDDFEITTSKIRGKTIHKKINS